ncbi:MAG: hypothetical protein GMKNLPBB_02284 [Myxococcota bacterium]|nr:hypothetical protein [Myxococcota bacterium]
MIKPFSTAGYGHRLAGFGPGGMELIWSPDRQYSEEFQKELAQQSRQGLWRAGSLFVLGILASLVLASTGFAREAWWIGVPVAFSGLLWLMSAEYPRLSRWTVDFHKGWALHEFRARRWPFTMINRYPLGRYHRPQVIESNGELTLELRDKSDRSLVVDRRETSERARREILTIAQYFAVGMDTDLEVFFPERSYRVTPAAIVQSPEFGAVRASPDVN